MSEVAGSDPVIYTMRVYFKGRIPGFHPGDAGSIPVTRTGV